MLKCITWNLAHRLKKNPKQIKAIEERNPDWKDIYENV